MIGFFNSYKKEVFLNGNESVKAKAQSHNRNFNTLLLGI